MQDWNVVVTVYEDGFKQALESLSAFGPVSQTDYFNVLTMNVDDIEKFLVDFKEHVSKNLNVLNSVSRVMPVMTRPPPLLVRQEMPQHRL